LRFGEKGFLGERGDFGDRGFLGDFGENGERVVFGDVGLLAPRGEFIPFDLEELNLEVHF
jgi:hypothetical protein